MNIQPQSIETRKKISLALKGRKRPDVAQRLRERLKEEHPMFGRHHTEQSKKKNSIAHLGKNASEKHYLWKGDNAGYRALHYWVVSHLGQPDTCEYCGATGLKGKYIQWANKSHQYKRDLSDWIRLCGKCHSRYDRKETFESLGVKNE